MFCGYKRIKPSKNVLIEQGKHDYNLQTDETDHDGSRSVCFNQSQAKKTENHRFNGAFFESMWKLSLRRLIYWHVGEMHLLEL